MFWIVLVIGILVSVLVLNASSLIDNDPFYMGDRDELWIDYCKVCKTRHDRPHCEGD